MSTRRKPNSGDPRKPGKANGSEQRIAGLPPEVVALLTDIDPEASDWTATAWRLVHRDGRPLTEAESRVARSVTVAEMEARTAALGAHADARADARDRLNALLAQRRSTR